MSEQELQNKIIKLTNKIKDENPTVYKHLLENPNTIPNAESKDFKDELRAYYDFLQKLAS
jgi:hypothetical protein